MFSSCSIEEAKSARSVVAAAAERERRGRRGATWGDGAWLGNGALADGLALDGTHLNPQQYVRLLEAALRRADVVIHTDDFPIPHLRATAEAAYLDAICEIEVSFAPPHPLRLARGLSRAVQLYEVEGNLAAACALAQSTIDAAETEIGLLHRDEEAYEDSQRVLQLLRDNLATWTRALPVGVALGLGLHRYDSNRS